MVFPKVPSTDLQSMSLHLILIFTAGITALLIFLLPHLLKNRLLSPPMIFVGIGFLLFSLPVDLPFINPESDDLDRKIVEYLTEFIVILSLAAIGLKIDRKPSFKNWASGWALVGIAMPITIILLGLAGHYVLGLSLAASILLGAGLSPTDPVLASNVQVDPPNSGEGHPVKFALTVEAGLNDALAFPFIFLALVLEEQGLSWLTVGKWFSFHFIYKILIGILVGFVVGKIIAKYFFSFIENIDDKRKKEISEGTFLVAATLLTYGFAEFFQGYGFLAVFVAATTGRQIDKEHPAHKRTYQSVDQVEQALIGIFLVAFGGILATNGLTGLSLGHILVGCLLVFIIRPLSGMLSLLSFKAPFREKALVSFFGIRGIGTIYYLAFATNEFENFGFIEDIWLVANFTIILSIFVHGLADAFLLTSIEKKSTTTP
ncbi:cation:proton antiporter [Portibacter marinus]|uniref:cation:proton antiporter n=1 Tax=Portibacter marinus TaxID=2898660 RepID=UPI001F169139|nr:cation:proton antiporter [Portibacter marinus]